MKHSSNLLDRMLYTGSPFCAHSTDLGSVERPGSCSLWNIRQSLQLSPFLLDAVCRLATEVVNPSQNTLKKLKKDILNIRTLKHLCIQHIVIQFILHMYMKEFIKWVGIG